MGKTLEFGEENDSFILVTYDLYGGKNELKREEIVLHSPIKIGGFIKTKIDSKIKPIGNSISYIEKQNDKTVVLGTEMYKSYTLIQN